MEYFSARYFLGRTVSPEAEPVPGAESLPVELGCDRTVAAVVG